MKTTLNKIREHSPCAKGWNKLLKILNKPHADDDLSFLAILESNGLDDALWCLRSAPEYDRDSWLFAVWCARQVQHLMTDPRSINALDVAERYVNGLATEDELAVAVDAAYAATFAASDDSRDAALAALAGLADAYNIADAAARATGAAAYAPTRAAQTEMFIKMCKGNAPWQGEPN